MVKKRRDFKKVNKVDLTLSNKAIYEEIGELSETKNVNETRVDTFGIKSMYGKGNVTRIGFEDITIVICSFKLGCDLVFKQRFSEDFVALCFLMDGEKVVSVRDFGDVFFESGDAYMARMRCFDCDCKIAAHRPCKEMCIKLSASFLAKHGFENDIMVKEFVDDNLIVPITNEALAIIESIERLNIGGVAMRIFLKAKVFELLAILVSNYKSGGVGLSASIGSNLLKKLFTVKRIIDENLKMNYSVNGLSREVGLNKTILDREFLRVFGLTVHQYSIAQKIKKAQSLLSNTDLPIYEIAEEIGYKNATHFSAAFKREVGMAPKNYRINSLD
ncbi:helix-turn-helix transcriptional regulator [Maribacter sp. MMG018]|uniref:helix-turn-helix domain-containing protein n=1 Tax=Maribacter sp. MMG018 TaxID=2822688 RepID=UPI001B376A83|nr:AraC family transcriptional regulator [Maribacter sp. MMG018]MBQ4914223.1 helix-turn-helix transcriptional regulator [Maribacter sp. MMG018]